LLYGKKKDVWYLLLFTSVLIVNIGYFTLGISHSLDEALLANRLAYLGSVLLPLSMCMIILNITNLSYRKWLPGLLLGIGIIVFLIAASPGYLDIYYKEVSLVYSNGLTILHKVYGPLHGLYMLYLFGYFIAMVAVVVYATVKNKIKSLARAVILIIALFVNIGVWLIEQLVCIDFEILSISYIISESFLLGLRLLIAETEKNKMPIVQDVPIVAEVESAVAVTEEPVSVPDCTPNENLQLAAFAAGISELTPKEQEIFQCYVDGMTTAQILEQLNIKENTLKFHNKNLYGKLGVSSRKQLLALYKLYAVDRDEQ